MGKENAEGSSKSVTELLPRQQAVLVGTLLGDGCLAKHGKHHRLHVKHATRQRKLAEFKYLVFRDRTSMRMHEFDQMIGSRGYPSVQFATRTDPAFTEWHSCFYQGGRKVVPASIAGWLSPLAVAVWFMDDGAADFAGVTFQTHGFRGEEVELLANVMSDSFDLAVTTRANKGKRILYVRAASLGRFARLVDRHLLPDFRYRLIARRLRTP